MEKYSGHWLSESVMRSEIVKYGIRKPRRSARYPSRETENGQELKEVFDAAAKTIADLPAADNAAGSVDKMLRANAILRNVPWPQPFDETTHKLCCADARQMPWLADESVHLVVTSPPYWTLKEYEKN